MIGERTFFHRGFPAAQQFGPRQGTDQLLFSAPQARNAGTEMLFEIFSQRYERSATTVTSNLPFKEWTEILGSERLTGALLDRLTHHARILEMNGESYRLKESQKAKTRKARA